MTRADMAAVFVGVAIFAVVGWQVGVYDPAPTSLPSPPPACVRGETPQRHIFPDGDHVMTCEVRP